jgi:hypothetical protein
MFWFVQKKFAGSGLNYLSHFATDWSINSLRRPAAAARLPGRTPKLSDAGP